MLQTNATVTQIVGGGTPADWELGGSAGAEKWAGISEAYYRAKVSRDVQDGTTTRVTRHYLIVEQAIADVVDHDDTIVFSFRGEPKTGQVEHKPEVDLDVAPPAVRTVRLELKEV